MKLSTLRLKTVGRKERIILETLWDIVNGQYPKIEGLTEQECKDLFEGGRIPGIANPFVGLSPNMEVKPLKPMLLRTTHDLAERDRQMAVHYMYNNINHMLVLLQQVSEIITCEELFETH